MGRIIDISFPIDEHIAIYPSNPGFEVRRVQDMDNGDGANVSAISMGSHTGTHVDVPSHFIHGGETLDQIPLEKMCGRAKVIDATGIDDITAEFLKKIEICKDDILLFRTDNSNNWSCDRILDDYITLAYDAAEYLVDRGVKLVGIDYLTIERPRSKRIEGKSVHETLLGNGILICEALNIAGVCGGEYEFFCIPLCIKGLDGCPVRCVLREDDNEDDEIQ